MKHIKLFEGFQANTTNEAKADDANISLKKAKKRAPVEEAEKSDEEKEFEKKEKDATDRLEKLFKKLVPPSGAAETVEGEMVRAVMRVWYRYFNDGDYFFRGYGKETAQPSVRWLSGKNCPIGKQLRSIFNDAKAEALPAIRRGSHPNEYTYMDGYLINLIEAANAVSDYVESKNGKYTPNTTEDSRNAKTNEAFDWEDYDNTDLAGMGWETRCQQLVAEFAYIMEKEMPVGKFPTSERKQAFKALGELFKNAVIEAAGNADRMYSGTEQPSDAPWKKDEK